MGGSTGNDDWIFTPPMNFDDHAADYELSFDVAMYHEDFRSSDISAYLCDKLNPDNIVEQLIEYKPKVDDTSFNRLSQVFTVPKAGVYYIAFHTTSKPYQYGVLVKEIDIKKSEKGNHVRQLSLASVLKERLLESCLRPSISRCRHHLSMEM